MMFNPLEIQTYHYREDEQGFKLSNLIDTETL
jgi:hypothetical protein